MAITVDSWQPIKTQTVIPSDWEVGNKLRSPATWDSITSGCVYIAISQALVMIAIPIFGILQFSIIEIDLKACTRIDLSRIIRGYAITNEIACTAKFMGPVWGPPGSCRPQMGPMLSPWSLLSWPIISRGVSDSTWWILQLTCFN